MFRIRASIVLAATAAAFVPATASAAPPYPALKFPAPQGLSPKKSDEGSIDPQIASAPDGTTTVVWAQSHFSGSPRQSGTGSIQIRRVSPSGKTSQTTSIPVGDRGYDVDPDVAVDASGNAIVVWQERADEIRSVAMRADGSLGAVNDLGLGATFHGNAQVAFDTSGRPFAAYRSRAGLATVAALSADGAPGTVTQIGFDPSGPALQGGDTVALDSSGPMRVVWTTGSAVNSALLADDGTPGATTSVIPSQSGRIKMTPPSVSNGKVAVGVDHYDSREKPTILLADTDGEGGVTTVSDGPLEHGKLSRLEEVDLAVSSSGVAVVSWLSRAHNEPTRLVADLVYAGGTIRHALRRQIVLAFGKEVLTAAPGFAGDDRPIIAAGGKSEVSVGLLAGSGKVRDMDVPRSTAKYGIDGMQVDNSPAGLRLIWVSQRRDVIGSIATSLSK